MEEELKEIKRILANIERKFSGDDLKELVEKISSIDARYNKEYYQDRWKMFEKSTNNLENIKTDIRIIFFTLCTIVILIALKWF